MDAKVGKLLVIGASLGCLSPALTIAACLSYKSPFSAPFEQQDAAMRAKQGFAATGVQSDILSFPAADWCTCKFLRWPGRAAIAAAMYISQPLALQLMAVGSSIILTCCLQGQGSSLQASSQTTC